MAAMFKEFDYEQVVEAATRDRGSLSFTELEKAKHAVDSLMFTLSLAKQMLREGRSSEHVLAAIELAGEMTKQPRV